MCHLPFKYIRLLYLHFSTLCGRKGKVPVGMIKAGIYFTCTGPILILTSFDSLCNSKLIDNLAKTGIDKFIVYDVSESKVKEQYGTYYGMILNDLCNVESFRILDHDGYNIFENFSFADLGEPVYYEP